MPLAVFGDAGSPLDRRAKSAYRQRLLQLDEHLELASSFGDAERVRRVQEEIDFLARHVSAAVGLGGRDRKTSGAVERARVNVTRAIRAAMARMALMSAELGCHLRGSIRTGVFCSYSLHPRSPEAWEVG
jgi:non-specific serine/threonine protein kinase